MNVIKEKHLFRAACNDHVCTYVCATCFTSLCELVSIYMLCNYGHCSLCCILILMGKVWHLFSLWYLHSVFLLCVNICRVRCFSILLLFPPSSVRLLKLWVGLVYIHHSQMLAPPLDPRMGPWGNSPSSSKWCGRDALQPQNRWVWMGFVGICLMCYKVIFSSGTYH